MPASSAKRSPVMPKPSGLSPAESHFWDRAGWSYGGPKNPSETPEQGRERCARYLARVEVWAASEGLQYQWEYDGQTDESFRETSDPYPLWACYLWNGDGSEMLANLCGIDLGRDGTPRTDPYRRVVEAELASEVNRIASWVDDSARIPA